MRSRKQEELDLARLRSRGGYAPLFAVAVIREEDDGTLTAALDARGRHTQQWDSDLGMPDAANASSLPAALRLLAEALEEIGGGGHE